MVGRKLKLYDEYVQRIEFYAKASRIKILYAEEPGDGSYSPSRRRIRIDTDLEESHEISVLLHELGHSLDDTLVSRTTEQVLSRAYGAFYKERHTAKQLKEIVKCEKRAWKYARGIAKHLKINLGKWFDISVNHCLSAYKES